ncbi:MAG: Magnesium transporter MgtE [Chlamydiia bacterium]|nr:Magnesium transporter MgtE [Chlamydiia bacterium]
MKRKHLDHQIENYLRNTQNILELDQSIAEAITSIREKDYDQKKPYFYVLDDKSHLIGIVSIKTLLNFSPEAPLKDAIKTNVHITHSEQSMFEALALMQKFHLLSLPVIKQGAFVGVIEIQEFFEEELEITSKRKRLQIFQMLGILVEEGPTKSIWRKYIHRMPWVFCNMLGGILCAVISDFYEVVLVHVIVLAMFIPLVLSLSESISMQAMTVSIYLMTHKRQKWRKIFRYTFREIGLYVLIALTASLSVGLLSLLWREGIGPSFIICVSIFISIIVTAILGAMIPIILYRWKLDPRVASGPIVLMFADVITTMIYLSLAFWLLL